MCQFAVLFVTCDLECLSFGTFILTHKEHVRCRSFQKITGDVSIMKTVFCLHFARYIWTYEIELLDLGPLELIIQFKPTY